MENLNLKSSSKKVILVVGFCIFLSIFSMFLGRIFAEENTSSSTSSSYYTTNTNYTLSTNYAPMPPTNLSFSNSGTSSATYILLKWKDNADNENGFNLEKKLSSTTNWATLAQISVPDIIDFKDTAVSYDVMYDYRIQACAINYGCSEFAYLYQVSLPVQTTFTDNQTDNTTTSSTEITETTQVSNLTNTTDTVTINETTTEISPTLDLAPAETLPIVESSAILPSTKFAIDQRVEVITNVNVRLFPSIIAKLLGIQETAALGTIASLSTYADNLYWWYINFDSKTDGYVAEPFLKNFFAPTIESSTSDQTFTIPIPTESSPILMPDISTTTIDQQDGTTETEDGNTVVSQTDTEYFSETLNEFSEVLKNQPETSEKFNNDFFYKDTLYIDSNKDGISDHDSVYIYNIDPIEPSPVSLYEGRNINAGEKILLGFDPSQPEIVKMTIEEPLESTATTLSTYKVNEVVVTENQEIVLKGQALPNSFITLYIYSTPIVVTVKTDNTGEWEYVLDKELENGDHTIYTATVNNSGNIIARSPGYLFTKTAEAVTLKDLPLVDISTNEKKPGLLEGSSPYIILGSIVGLIAIVLIIAGATNKKKETTL